jgi:hypothetical protein
MNDLEAMKNAAALGNAFSARDDVIRAYAVAFKGYDATLMGDAVEYAVENCERLPTVKGVIAMYRKAEALARIESKTAGTPCHFCQVEGGWHLDHSTQMYPPREASAPYLPGIVVRDDAGMVLGQAWGHPPACASHGRQISRSQGHNGHETGWVKDRAVELREWRDRWEAMHAESAAAAIEESIANDHRRPTEAAAKSFVAQAIAAPHSDENVAVAGDFQLPSETSVPMTPDEEASFNAGIRF